MDSPSGSGEAAPGLTQNQAWETRECQELPGQAHARQATYSYTPSGPAPHLYSFIQVSSHRGDMTRKVLQILLAANPTTNLPLLRFWTIEEAHTNRGDTENQAPGRHCPLQAQPREREATANQCAQRHRHLSPLLRRQFPYPGRTTRKGGGICSCLPSLTHQEK